MVQCSHLGVLDACLVSNIFPDLSLLFVFQFFVIHVMGNRLSTILSTTIFFDFSMSETLLRIHL